MQFIFQFLIAPNFPFPNYKFDYFNQVLNYENLLHKFFEFFSQIIFN